MGVAAVVGRGVGRAVPWVFGGCGKATGHKRRSATVLGLTRLKPPHSVHVSHTWSAGTFMFMVWCRRQEELKAERVAARKKQRTEEVAAKRSNIQQMLDGMTPEEVAAWKADQQVCGPRGGGSVQSSSWLPMAALQSVLFIHMQKYADPAMFNSYPRTATPRLPHQWCTGMRPPALCMTTFERGMTHAVRAPTGQEGSSGGGAGCCQGQKPAGES